MSKHAYASSNKNQVATLGWLAVFAVIIAILANYSYKNLEAREEWKWIAAYGYILSPISLGAAFGICYWLYNQFLWKYFSGIPVVAGTWIGMTQPNYVDSPHLTIMTIEQSWSEIAIIVNGHIKEDKNQKWKLPLKKLGKDKSTTASISELAAGEADIIIACEHKGQKDKM